MSDNIFNYSLPEKDDSVVETPIETPAEAPAVETVEAPVVEEKADTVELVAEPTLEPAVEVKPENVINAIVTPEPVAPVVPKQVNKDGKIAIYALRTLTLPSGTIPKGYSYVSKGEYDKVAKHKAVRLATKEEIATNL